MYGSGVGVDSNVVLHFIFFKPKVMFTRSGVNQNVLKLPRLSELPGVRRSRSAVLDVLQYSYGSEAS